MEIISTVSELVTEIVVGIAIRLAARVVLLECRGVLGSDENIFYPYQFPLQYF